MNNINSAKNAAKIFCFEGEIEQINEFGNGHINDTYLVTTTVKKYILQKMNTNIFKKPLEVLENIENVTKHLKKKITENNGDINRETLTLIKTIFKLNYYRDENNHYWRAYNFIDNATSYDKVLSNEDFYESAYSFGKFQNLLADFDASKLHETIKDFHNTKKRYETFLISVNKDVKSRKHLVEKEIEFVIKHQDLTEVLSDMPLRVTHNDTKLNNIMMDNETHKGICVIDLDTVMPGLAVNDFGDSIRFGASTGAEDEIDLTKIECDLELFECYTKGFILGCNGQLTRKEIEMLPYGALVMTYECGMRFLTDYLDGDVYFKISRVNHNLDRARTQFKLVDDMIKKLDKMKDIVNKYM